MPDNKTRVNNKKKTSTALKPYKRDLKNALKNIDSNIEEELKKEVCKLFDRCGLFYKCFTRIKSPESAIKKIDRKIKTKSSDYKLQDLIGMRIVVYFKKDIALCEDLIKNNFEVDNVSKDIETTDTFKPQRINYVCKLPSAFFRRINKELWNLHVDSTFEIQIRTIFSEGWHEVEHDFRYKCKDDWEDLQDLARTFNGIFATLDTCDWAIENILQAAGRQYFVQKKWIPMLRNVFRIRVKNDGDMKKILELLDKDSDLASALYHVDRTELLETLSSAKQPITLTLENLVYMANYISIRDERLTQLTPGEIVEQLN